MINARAQLYRLLREFFDTCLPGVPWHVLEHAAEEPAQEVVKGRARFPFGKAREVIEVRWGRCSIRVLSSLEAPPLGMIRVDVDGQQVEEKSLDKTAWDRIGKFILARQKEGTGNGRR